MDVVSVSLGAAAVGAVAAGIGIWIVRGTTAVPAAAWAVVAWAALACEMLVRLRGGLVEPGPAACARLLVAALSLCPAMSLLGAKRPQHGVWQFIVASLAAVLVLPAGPATLAFPGSLPAVHVLAAWFMLVLAGIGWMNFIATRRGLAATLVAAGQLVLMRPFLPWSPLAEGIEQAIAVPAVDGAAACTAALGAVLAVAQGVLAGRRRMATAASVHPLAAVVNPPYLALRETFGAAWALRVAERFDQIAASRGWPCRLAFGGLTVDDGAAAGAWQRDAWRAFAALMRRFVTAAWLRRHAGPRTMQESVT